MGKPYSDDLRERVVAAIEAGHSRVKVAELYNMALSTVGGFIKRKRETGSVSPDKFGGQSGRIEARTGLRMMPTFPRSPLSFRTAGFPQYGWKAGVSGETFPARRSA